MTARRVVRADPSALGLQPFALAGISAAVFPHWLNGGQNVPYQIRPAANFGAGINYPLLGSAIGLRLSIAASTPATDFGLQKFTTNAYRLTSEPMAGVYLHF